MLRRKISELELKLKSLKLSPLPALALRCFENVVGGTAIHTGTMRKGENPQIT
jgi:hypothetical protein